MFDDKKLWKERAGGRFKDLGKYLRYIFNGHLVIVLLFLIGTAAFYYQKWIGTLPSGFPVEMIMAVIMGVFLTYSPVYNFLLEADQVFLLPLENRLRGYFGRSGIVSFIFQGYFLLIVFAVLMPMYAHHNKEGYHSFFLFLIVLLALKAWNLATSWRIHFYVESSSLRLDMIVRYFLNAAFAFLLLKHANVLILIALGIVMVLYYRTFYHRTRDMGLKWNQLIEAEEKRMGSFYRLANLFTDVPTLKDTVKRRKWLDFFIGRISFTQDKTFLYLFSRTFLRSSDYLGLFIRLTVIGGLALYFLSFGSGQILLSVLFLYLTGFQLLPLWNHHQNKLWIDLYPVEERFKAASFHFLLMMILTVQNILFFLIILMKGQLITAFLEMISSIVFSYIFVYFYSKTRIKV